MGIGHAQPLVTAPVPMTMIRTQEAERLKDESQREECFRWCLQTCAAWMVPTTKDGLRTPKGAELALLDVPGGATCGLV